jgi:hypothetical protein
MGRRPAGDAFSMAIRSTAIRQPRVPHAWRLGRGKMSFIRGVIFGAILVVLIAYVHDTKDAGANSLVNWSRVAELGEAASSYVREEWDQFTKWLKSR